MKQFDVIVIGAGLAGLQAARLLAARGVQVAIVDRKRTPDQFVHTTGIFVRRTLEDFSLPDALLGAPIREVTLWSPARRSVTFASPHDEFRVGRMKPLYRQLHREALSAGCEWIGETSFVRSEWRDGVSRVTLSTNGREWNADSRFVVGGDGATSRVAADLDLHRNREWIVGLEEIHPSSGRNEPAMHCFLDAKRAPGYIGWLVDDGEEIHVGVGGYADRFRAGEAMAGFRDSLRSRFEFGTAPIETRGGRIPVGGVGTHLANQRGLLIGDAAGAVSPLTAGGLDAALRLSSYAADVIVRHLGGVPSALAGYSGTRFRSRFVSRLWMRKMFATFQSDVLMEIAVGSLRIPGLHHLGGHVFFGRGSFPIPVDDLGDARVFSGA
jgi:flavin-dependent dehydrogenase